MRKHFGYFIVIFICVFTANAEVFTPQNLSSALWLDASDSNSLTLSGTSVIQWADKSGNSNHAVAPGSSNRPVYDSATSSIIFDGIDDILNSADIDYGPGNEITVFAVAEPNLVGWTPANQSGWIVSKGRYTGSAPYGILITPNNTLFAVNSVQIFMPVDSNTHILGQVYNGAEQYAIYDGQLTNPSTASPASNNDSVGIGSAGADPTYRPFPGRIMEVIIYQKALSQLEIFKVTGYLAHKWSLQDNLPSYHPFKNTDFTVMDEGFSVDEDEPNGTSLGYVEAVSVGDPMTFSDYAISDNSFVGDIFAVDSVSGELTVSDNTYLNYELAEEHFLTMTVSNGSQTSSPGQVHVTVNDVNDGDNGINYSQLWGRWGELWNPFGRLPDFSWAGYHNGEADIPEIEAVTNVLDYGAIPDDGVDDTNEIQAAIDATASGAVYLPAGQYDIDGFLVINKSNIVLRGDGDDANGTILYSEYNATEKTGGYDYAFSTGGDGYLIKIGQVAWANITDITAAAVRGQHTITVANATPFQPGMVVGIKMTDDQLYGSLFDHLHNDQISGWDTGSPCSWGGPEGPWLFHIESKNGNDIILREPLRFDVRLEWNPQLQIMNLVEETGIEELRIKFKYITPPEHLTEPGYNGFQFNWAVDSWAKNVTIEDSDNGIGLERCGWIELQDITLTGRRGHHGISISQTNDSIFKNLTINTDGDEAWIHGTTINHSACGNIISRLSGNNLLHLDFHRDNPFENLYTEVLSEWDFESSGDICAGPHSAARSTFWNLCGVNTNMPDWDFIQTNIITNSTLTNQFTQEREWYERKTNLQPCNLYLAQLDMRLAPSAPANLSAVYDSNQLILDWDDNTEGDVINYMVYKSSISGGGYVLVAPYESSSQYTDSAVVYGSTYYYKIKSKDVYNDQSDYSDELMAVAIIPGDFSKNGNVNFEDFAELAQGWLTVYTINELLELAQNWLRTNSN
jgi:hypothetical protein